MKKIKKYLLFWLLFLVILPCFVRAEEMEEPGTLYARSAVLMDADSGRILFDKNGEEKLANASTTKILTCILALEKGEPEQQVVFSEEAAKQPEVHLGAAEGENFHLGDLLYSLMLESHNDTAVAVAEAISGSTAAFAKAMNEKAKEIGCRETHFVSPNGLDWEDAEGDHSCRSGTDSPLLYSGIPETERVPEDYADGGEDLFQPCREQELFLRQPQCLSFHDGRGPDGKNRLYGEGRLLLCGGAERWRTYFRHCPSGLRLAEQQDL